MKNSKAPKIMVTIRKRPMTRKEISKGEKDVVNVDDSNITIGEEREKVDLTKYVEYHRYKFDRVYDETITNRNVSSIDL
jgi:kinesin family protein 2/24